MTDKQKLQQRLKKQLDVLNQKIADETDLGRLGKFFEEQEKLEIRYQEAGKEEPTEEPTERPAPTPLVRRVDPGEYALAAFERRSVTGSNLELAQELKMDDRPIIPWAVLADGMPIDPEERADATTNGPTSGQQSTQHQALRRIFRGSLVDLLGVNVQNVGPGRHSYPILGSGASAAWYAKNAEVSSVAATITAVEAGPARLSSRYSWTRESALEFSQLGELLRNDLRQVMVAKGSDVVINGTGTSPEPGGIFAQLTAPTAPNAGATIRDFRTAVMAGLGDFASSSQEVRLFLALDAYTWLSGLSSQTGDLVGEPYVKNLADLRISNVLPNAPTSGARQSVSEGITFGTRGTGSGLLLWFGGGIELVADSVSGASKAEIYLTALAFGQTVWRTTAPYKRASFKVAS